MAKADDLTLREDSIDFAAHMKDTDTGHAVRAAHHYRMDLEDEVQGISEWGRQTYLPWDKTRELFQFRPGETTVWVGFNGHGKSLLAGQVAMSQMAQGEVVLILSFEMKPRRTLARMFRQWLGRKYTPEDARYVDEFLDWCDGKVWLYDQRGMVDGDKVLAVIRWAAKHKGITHAIIDNLAKCVRSEEDLNPQKFFVDAVCTIGIDTNTHMHLIVHPKKQVDESKPPRKMDIRGSATITDAPDNVMCIWKNKPKIEARLRGDISKNHEPDTALIIDKQRNGESWEGTIALGFHLGAQQFIDQHASGALDLRTYPHRDRYAHGFQV